jgi:hypothetical protein
MDNFDKKLKSEINLVKKHIAKLKNMGFSIEIQQTETMVGKDVLHIYLRDRLNGTGRIVLQKYLFTIEERNK